MLLALSPTRPINAVGMPRPLAPTRFLSLVRGDLETAVRAYLMIQSSDAGINVANVCKTHERVLRETTVDSRDSLDSVAIETNIQIILTGASRVCFNCFDDVEAMKIYPSQNPVN